MKNLIYQYWDGNVKESVRAGSEAMREYSVRIGADYVFEDNPRYIKDRRFGNYSPHYGAFKPVFEKPFRDYDNVLFADTDVFPKKSLVENIFEVPDPGYHIAIAQEPDEPARREITLGRITSASDNKWATMVKDRYGASVPRDEKGRVKVYNTGVVLYSNKGMENVRGFFDSFDYYVNDVKAHGLDSFYTCDQPYLHCQMFAFELKIHELSPDWNSIITGARLKGIKGGNRHIIDGRTDNSKFVHCQFPGADDMDNRQLEKIVNLPREEWGYDI